mgnify:CR=1 FL=1
MDSLALARVVHVLGVVLWIGGVSMVTTVLLPALRRMKNTDDPIALFERIEGAFGLQAKVTTLATGLTGFYMLHAMDAWQRYTQVHYWWLHLMTLVWFLFTLVLFVFEPLFLHRWFSEAGAQDPTRTLARAQRLHAVLLTASLLAIVGAVAGGHGWFFIH